MSTTQTLQLSSSGVNSRRMSEKFPKPLISNDFESKKIKIENQITSLFDEAASTLYDKDEIRDEVGYKTQKMVKTG